MTHKFLGPFNGEDASVVKVRHYPKEGEAK
jgi:hypothetical protein